MRRLAVNRKAMETQPARTRNNPQYDASRVQSKSVGTVTMDFSSPSQGAMQFWVDGVNRRVPIERLIFEGAAPLGANLAYGGTLLSRAWDMPWPTKARCCLSLGIHTTPTASPSGTHPIAGLTLPAQLALASSTRHLASVLCGVRCGGATFSRSRIG
jgi:hypothetical protein